MSVLGKKTNTEEKENNGGKSVVNAVPNIKEIENWTNKNQKQDESSSRSRKVDKYMRKPKITLYMNEVELETLRNDADEHGMSISSYVLMKLVYKK